MLRTNATTDCRNAELVVREATLREFAAVVGEMEGLAEKTKPFAKPSIKG